MTRPIDKKTVAFYLQQERQKQKEEPKSELINGVIVEMPGVKPPHHLIAGTVYALLWNALDGVAYNILFDGVPFKKNKKIFVQKEQYVDKIALYLFDC